MAGRLRKKARRMETRTRPSSTQDPFYETSDEESKQEVNDSTTTSPFSTQDENKNPNSVLTQRTGDAVEALFLIKQEERHEFIHNSANKQGPTTYDDGMFVYGMTQEQREAVNSATEEEQQQPQQQKITRKPPQVNPYKKARVDPPSSQPLITPPPTRAVTRNSTTGTPIDLTTTLATTDSLPLSRDRPPVAHEDSDDDSDEEIAKSISSNLIEDDCMLFS